ncbi:MAG: radical SAM protein [Clostridia bacterium]|nr:radical SAM protein [Clostridia bacterium]
MDVLQLKREQLDDLARHRDRLRENPHLRWLFFEITDRCNLCCRHCGSRCVADGQMLSVEDVERTLRSVQPEQPMICLTGGEPMLHPDLPEIARCVRDSGFFWGMTTNATLIDEPAAQWLREAGLETVSVSLDGMEHAHDLLRGQKGAWCRAIRGVQALQRVGLKPQITTVLHRENFSDLRPMYELLCDLGITSWRPINIEPIGRACESRDLLLVPEQFNELLAFIREKRFDPDCRMEVTFGCSHYLGIADERMVRDHYFLCGAGILTASVRSNGDICACLDVENRRELVQGNIRTDDFMEVWENRFQAFRRDRTADCDRCLQCGERFRCGGDSAHTWDYTKNEPLLCYLDFRCTW